MAGPVPITGAVWGEFAYGARLGVAPRASAPTCDLNRMEFEAVTTFTPQLGLNGLAQVGVGISGLLSAGVRGMVNLVTVGVPLELSFGTSAERKGGTIQTELGFDLDVQLALATLSGWIAVYVEALFLEQEFVLFRWNGVGPESISLLGAPLGVKLPLFVMEAK
jgi:hypothetical protein